MTGLELLVVAIAINQIFPEKTEGYRDQKARKSDEAAAKVAETLAELARKKAHDDYKWSYAPTKFQHPISIHPPPRGQRKKVLSSADITERDQLIQMGACVPARLIAA